MKYFSSSYWFKLWVLSAPLFKDKIKGINAKSIDNKSDIKNQETTLFNNQSYLNLPLWNNNLTRHTEYHKHRHQKHKNRLKRTLNNENEIRGYRGKVTCSFTPKTFEDIIRYYYEDMDWSYGKRFQFKIKILYNHDDMYDNSDISITSSYPWTWQEIENVGEVFYEKFSTIVQAYVNSSKKERIETIFTYYGTVVFKSVRIITEDTHYNNNNLLDNLKRDFPNWNKNINITLGLINDNNDSEIKKSLKSKYPNLKLYCINIFDKQFSYFSNSDNKTKSFGGFSTKIFGNNTDKHNCYSYGPTKPIFTYVTQDKLNEISNIIANDSKFKQWFAHINDWNSTLPQAINNSKTFTLQALYNWKRQEKEIIKGYIRDWSYISTLIEQELKLDELNKNIQRIKVDFESIKNQVNELDNRLLNLENKSNLNCKNTFTIVSGAFSIIPVIGNVVGGLTTIASGVCAIAGV